MKIKYISLFFIILFVFTFQYGAVHADVSGQEREFLLYGDFAGSNKTISKATLRFISDKAYFYVDNTYFNSLDRKKEGEFFVSLKGLADEYDDNIYPVLTEKFGAILEPGIDDEDKIYILLLSLESEIGGYTNVADGFLKKDVLDGKTNEKDLVYVNVDYLGKDIMKGFLAHEIQHLISIQHKEVLKGLLDDIWLNELRSEYALELVNYNEPFSNGVLALRKIFFENYPTDPLTEWAGESSDYAVVNMLAQYMSGVYGDEVFKNMLENDKTGIESVDQALLDAGYSDDFYDVFRNWQIANYINNQDAYGKKFGYSNEMLRALKVKPTISQEIREGLSQENEYHQKDWQMTWLEFYGSARYLNFDIYSDNELNISYVLKYNDDSFSFGDIELREKKAYFSVKDLGSNIKSFILLPFFTDKKTSFTENEPNRIFSLKISTDENDFKEVEYKEIDIHFSDGSLVRPGWKYDVYVVKGNIIRPLPSPEFLKFYDGEKINVLEREEFENFRESFLVRAIDDPKVYEINKEGKIQWLDISAEEFLRSGRSFSSVFEITKEELYLYEEGPKINSL